MEDLLQQEGVSYRGRGEAEGAGPLPVSVLQALAPDRIGRCSRRKIEKVIWESANRIMKLLKLVVQGIGHVPSFKNSKMIVTRPKVRLMTKPVHQLWMRRCEAALESAFVSLYQTTETGTPMVRSLRSWIACVAPLNDSVKAIPGQEIEVVHVPPGQEGFELTIEKV